MDKEYLTELIKNDECEWIEYKENWFDREELGCYISAMSNAAAFHGEDYAYFIWGVKDQTREIVGTSFNYDKDVKNEPIKHYLARLLNPSISFVFETFYFDDKKVVCLTIPRAKRIITEFNKERYIRIGSSKELFRKYPEREIDLAVILRNGLPTIINTASRNQNLTFTELKSYYVAKDAFINPSTFEENLSLYVSGTKRYNELAFILSNENDITCRVSIFSGKRKSDKQYSLNDFGKKCILISIDQIMNYIESFNITKLDETNRILERNDIHLFDSDCLREALLNAFIHNDWTDLNAPMISIFEDRIEILSYGGLPNKQTKMGFLAGKSKPRCNELAEIFLQLRLSERSGRGVTKIYDKYGEGVFDINDDFIKVTIPFAFERKFGSDHAYDSDTFKTIDEENSRKYTGVKKVIIEEMLRNPKVKTNDLIQITKLSKTSVQKHIKELSENHKIERVGSTKSGYWKVNEEE